MSPVYYIVINNFSGLTALTPSEKIVYTFNMILLLWVLHLNVCINALNITIHSNPSASEAYMGDNDVYLYVDLFTF